jgi:hypothetical protein
MDMRAFADFWCSALCWLTCHFQQMRVHSARTNSLQDVDRSISLFARHDNEALLDPLMHSHTHAALQALVYRRKNSFKDSVQPLLRCDDACKHVVVLSLLPWGLN